MKCVNSSSGKIRRLRDEEAEKLVRAGLAQYVPKSEWKKSDPDWKKRSANMTAKERAKAEISQS